MPKEPLNSLNEAQKLIKQLTRLVKKIRQETTSVKRVKAAQQATTEKTVAQFKALGLDCPPELQDLALELESVGKAYQEGSAARDLLAGELRTLMPLLKKPQKKSKAKAKAKAAKPKATG